MANQRFSLGAAMAKKQRQAAGDKPAPQYGLLPRPVALAPPAAPEFAFDEAKIGDTTVRGVANTLTNENRALRGPGLDEAEYAMARAIITGQLDPKRKRSVAPATAPRRLSPSEAQRAEERLRIARRAFIDAKMGRPDPAGGNTSYNHRDVRDAQRNRPRYGEPVYRNFGPFENANPSRAVGQDAYIVIYENNPAVSPGRNNQRSQTGDNRRRRR